MYKNRNLLAYSGASDDYSGYGRFLTRCILSKEERKITCWFAQRSVRDGRVPASEEDESYFRGLNFSNFSFFRSFYFFFTYDINFRSSQTVLWGQPLCPETCKECCQCLLLLIKLNNQTIGTLFIEYVTVLNSASIKQLSSRNVKAISTSK